MYKNILVPIEPSHAEKHEHALAMARQLAEDANAEITAITVVEPGPTYYTMHANLLDIQKKAGEESLADLRNFVGPTSEIKTKMLQGHPANTIIDYATENGVDCIVIASHKPGLPDYFLGSTAARVVRHAPCAVHVMR